MIIKKIDGLANLFQDMNLNLIRSTRFKTKQTEILIDDDKYEYKHSYTNQEDKTTWHLLKLIDAMKAEQSNTENKLIQIRTGLVQKRRPKYVIPEERIVIVIGDYTTFLRADGTENRASVMEWLTDMSYLVQF